VIDEGHRLGDRDWTALHSVCVARTYGEREAEFVPEAASATPSSALSPDAPRINGQNAATVLAAGTVRCGIDIELIDHLPRAAVGALVPTFWVPR